MNFSIGLFWRPAHASVQGLIQLKTGSETESKREKGTEEETVRDEQKMDFNPKHKSQEVFFLRKSSPLEVQLSNIFRAKPRFLAFAQCGCTIKVIMIHSLCSNLIREFIPFPSQFTTLLATLRHCQLVHTQLL